MSPLTVSVVLGFIGLLQGVTLWLMSAARADRQKRDDVVNAKLDGQDEKLDDIRRDLNTAAVAAARVAEKVDGQERSIAGLWDRLGVNRRNRPE